MLKLSPATQAELVSALAALKVEVDDAVFSDDLGGCGDHRSDAAGSITQYKLLSHLIEWEDHPERQGPLAIITSSEWHRTDETALQELAFKKLHMENPTGTPRLSEEDLEAERQVRFAAYHVREALID